MTAQVTYTGVTKRVCPSCSGNMVRTRRRQIDRVFSWFVPVQRYRCESFSCQWAGNFRAYDASHGASQSHSSGADSTSAGLLNNPPTAEVPKSFIAHLVLAAVGAAFVLVYTTTDWLSVGDSETADAQHEAWLASASLSGHGSKIQAQTRMSAASAPAAR